VPFFVLPLSVESINLGEDVEPIHRYSQSKELAEFFGFVDRFFISIQIRSEGRSLPMVSCFTKMKRISSMVYPNLAEIEQHEVAATGLQRRRRYTHTNPCSMSCFR